MSKPSNYTSKPWDSVIGKWEAEKIAQNIMVILSRTGNEWRQLSWQEYQEERKKDGGFTQMEHSYFEQVVSYCASAEDANRFCSSWCKEWQWKIATSGVLSAINQTQTKRRADVTTRRRQS